MSPTQSRRGPLNILDSEWRRSVWKRWLLSHLAGFEPVEPPAPPSESSLRAPPTPAGAGSATTAQSTATTAAQRPSVGHGAPAAVAPVLADEAPATPPPMAISSPTPEPAASPAVTQSVAPPPAPSLYPPPREPDSRRGEVRARFDALFDRLLSLEDTIDALGKRFALRAVHERRHDQRMQERLESTAESLERQTLVLESLGATVERIEQRVERLERRLRADGITPEVSEPREPRESRIAQSTRDEFDDLEQSFAHVSQSPSRAPSAADSESWDELPFSSSSIRGNLAEMSLPTVLAMLELERRTGVLKVCADDGSVTSVTLRDGALVGARQRDLETEPIEAVRDALRFRSGHFWFSQAKVEVASGPPRSVGSVLLEATRQNDEAVRSA